MRQGWSILIFAYNEAQSLAAVVDEAQATLRVLAPDDNEIVIVDDGSSDGTPQVTEMLQQRYRNVRSVRHPINRGIGPALLSAYGAARLENCVAIPGDGQFDPSELLPFAEIPSGTFVSFWRPKKEGYSIYRRALTFANGAVNRWLLGISIRDVNWVKAYKTADLRTLQLKLKSSLVASEICAKLLALGHGVREAQSHYRPRKGGVSRGGSLKTVLMAARETVKLARVVLGFKMARCRLALTSRH